MVFPSTIANTTALTAVTHTNNLLINFVSREKILKKIKFNIKTNYVY